MKSKKVNSTDLRFRLLKSCLLGAGFIIAVVAGFQFIKAQKPDDGAAPVFRAFFVLNQRVWDSIHSNTRLSPQKPAPVPGSPPRVNGDLGLESELNLEGYQIEVVSGDQRRGLTMHDIKSQPKSEVSTDFKCIEGWSSIFQYNGLRFSEFMEIFKVGRKPDGSYYRYVGLETPDREYYVSVDMKSMLHPQTFLAYEMNGLPLRVENGAPIRLMIPIKYGIKSLKRIGRIFFSDERPPDYWAERGYDWYSGL